MSKLAWTLAITLLVVSPAAAQEDAGAEPAKEAKVILLKDGTYLEGVVVEENADTITVKTTGEVSRTVTVSTKDIKGRVADGDAPFTPKDDGDEGDGPSDEDFVDDDSDEFDLGDELGDLLGESVDEYDAGFKLSLSGFGHITYTVDETDARPDRSRDSSTNQFVLGGLDLFLNARLDDWVYFVNETVFEFNDEGEAILDVERILLRFEIREYLNISAGRFHTRLGYWNEAFHHGEYVQNSVGRPAIFNFEDDDGLLPVHMIGVRIGGEHFFGDLGLHYDVEVGNGRRSVPDPPQITQDENDVKAVNIRLAVSNPLIQGLRVGANFYFDRIEENVDPAAPLHGKIDEIITGGHVVLELGSFKLIAEYLFVRHDEKSGAEETAYTHGYYVEAAYRVADVITFFFRYDAVDVSDKDTYFASVADLDTFAGGVRWDVASGVALKVQPFVTFVDEGPGGDNLEIYGAHFQASFAF